MTQNTLVPIALIKESDLISKLPYQKKSKHISFCSLYIIFFDISVKKRLISVII